MQMQMQIETNKDKSMGITFLESLTGAERHIFYTATEGSSYAEMAKMLKIKVSTVKKHRENICEKLRDILEGECHCRKWGAMGLAWLKFALKTDIIDGHKWVERIKKTPFCRD
jgi:DNA-binding CsgD family transcriptional regulator